MNQKIQYTNTGTQAHTERGPTCIPAIAQSSSAPGAREHHTIQQDIQDLQTTNPDHSIAAVQVTWIPRHALAWIFLFQAAGHITTNNALRCEEVVYICFKKGPFDVATQQYFVLKQTTNMIVA